MFYYPGVHCTQYPSVGKPELYLHESYKTLATPLKNGEIRERLEDSLYTATKDLPDIQLNIG